MRGQHISFCSFCSSCVLRETSIGVDYTQILKKKDCERKKEKCMFSPLHHLRPYNTERRSFVWERKIKFLNFIMPQWIFWEENISFCSFCSCGQRDYYYRGRLHREKKDWEKKVCECFPITSSPPPAHHRERRNFFFF